MYDVQCLHIVYREKNAKLVPQLLKRLKDMQLLGEEEREKAR